MSIFGGSYPPGCSGTSYDEEHLCAVCGLEIDDCICHECPECGEVGNPKCYEEHGMVRSPEQIKSLAEQEASWDAQNKAEADYWAEHHLDEGFDDYS